MNKNNLVHSLTGFHPEYYRFAHFLQSNTNGFVFPIENAC